VDYGAESLQRTWEREDRYSNGDYIGGGIA
jgi:hypothetical protein